MNLSPLEAAKERLPIPTLWQMLNLPGEPGRECFCPFHANRRTKAGSVFIGTEGEPVFKCHAGCTDKAVDSIGFLALAMGGTNEDGCRKLIEMAGVMPAATVPVRGKKAAPHKPALPPFKRLETPTRADMETLAKNRRIFINSIERAAERGHLWFADTNEGRAWVITDGRRIVAQSRRLDGLPWAGKGKAWTSIKESGGAGWPVGAASFGDCPNVLLCEGTPDFICAHESDDACPGVMLGAANFIHPEALPLFAGKRVRILAHGEDTEQKAGEKACMTWARQLRDAGAAEVRAVLLRGDGFKDLNELANVPFQQWKELQPATFLSFP
jgi:hypothetical protein